jgi:NAD(P)-dependent dehydrogenase (short-subunit alcohol dehydrogenase family)
VVAGRAWGVEDIPDQRGRVAIVTGANSGIGFEIARALASRGATVVLAVRDLDRGHTAVRRINAELPSARVTVSRLDLASLTSVRAAVANLRADYPQIDLLINNAGVMYPPRQSTEDGFELTLATNHLGPFALTGLLLDRLLAVPGSRVVTVSSMAHRIRARIDFADLQSERSFSRMVSYGQTKLANLMFTYELHRRLGERAATSALAAHPGAVRTALSRHSPMHLLVPGTLFLLAGQPAAAGALPILRAATDPQARGGGYYGPAAVVRGRPVPVRSSRRSRDIDVQRRLWDVSTKLTGVVYPV